jgi:uncharacterized protein (TIGR02145 family)
VDCSKRFFPFKLTYFYNKKPFEAHMKHIYLFVFILLFCSVSYSQNPCPGIATVDYGGQTYHTVLIGSQCWLKENLNVGTMIDSLANSGNNGIIEKYCYGNNPANCTTYGGLYQWNEAMQYVTTEKAKGICPTGWHIPKNAEYQTLATTVSNNSNTLKAVGQGTGNGAGTNTSGFSAVLAGDRSNSNGGYFIGLGFSTSFWSSTEYAEYADFVYLYSSDSNVGFYNNYKVNGFSVRCLNDISTGINDHSNNTLPKSINLLQNFPNPFNPSTTISFTLPERTRVVLSIYNEIGENVAELFNGEKAAGYHSIEWNASKFVSGIYFYELKTEKFTSVKKLILMK